MGTESLLKSAVVTCFFSPDARERCCHIEIPTEKDGKIPINLKYTKIEKAIQI